jgi:uncharacterized protein
MNPFFFGSSADPLYGVYHPAVQEGDEAMAAVLCYPMGIEYMRAHRAFRQLTTLLVRAGVHVLRFDYHGTGDSAGEGEEVSLDRWAEDVELAVGELKDNAGMDRISLVGLRLGGAVAAQAAARRTDIDRLVLWDPVVLGSAYLDELREYAHPPVSRAAKEWPRGTIGVGGFPLTGDMRREIAAGDLLHLRPAARSLHLIVSEDRVENRELRDAWNADGLAVDYCCVPSENRWAEGDAFGSALIPQNIIQTVVDCFARGGRA